MPESPHGKLLLTEGEPIAYFAASVPALAPLNTVILEAKAGHRYVVQAVCPSDACWTVYTGFPYHGPLGYQPSSYIIQSSTYLDPLQGIPYGALVVKPPGSAAWAEAGWLYSFVAEVDGPILASMAAKTTPENIYEHTWGEGAGSMPVSIQESSTLADDVYGSVTGTAYSKGDFDGPVDGKVDELETFSLVGGGGMIPEEGDLERQTGITKFQIGVGLRGIVNLVDDVVLRGFSHLSANDLRLSLVSPAGTRVWLANRFDADSRYDGDYAFVEASPDQLALGDPALSATSGSTIRVNQTLSSILVTAGAYSITACQTRSFAATAFDQYGNIMDIQPSRFYWSALAGASVNDGLVVAGANAGSYGVYASACGVMGGAGFAITPGFYTADPSSVAVAQASPMSVAWQAPSGHSALDWVGLYVIGDPNPNNYTWRNFTGSGTSGTMYLTAPATAGSYEFRYYSSAVVLTGTSVKVAVGTNLAPTVATPAAASPNPATGTTTTLSVLGADDEGESNLSYTWDVTTPEPASFQTFFFGNPSTNGFSKSSQIVQFNRAGGYLFRATIRDKGNLSVTSSVFVTVSQTLTTITVSPLNAVVVPGGTKQFTATALDQFGDPLSVQPAFSWAVSGGGAIGGTGLFTAGGVAGGPYAVSATSGGKTGLAGVDVGTAANQAPTVAAPMTADHKTVAWASCNLSVLGADVAGEENLRYSWTGSRSGPGPTVGLPDFSATGTNAAKDTVANFHGAGDYAIMATILGTRKVSEGEARPVDSLSNFIGEDARGVWTLEVRDYQHTNVGSLASWGMDLTVAATDHHVYVEPAPLQGRQEMVADYRPQATLRIPPAVEGGGTWPTTMPPNPTVFPINVNLVGELTEILFVGMSFGHGFAGDVHAVLVSPNGTSVTVFHRPGSVSGSTGNASQFQTGNYRFYENWKPLLPDTGNISPTSYRRDPGDWPGLPNDWNIGRRSFEDFVGEQVTGTWNLLVFDWYNNGIFGSITEAWLSLRFLA